jgi:hypothetical protein
MWMELDRFPLAAGGDERSAPNILESFLFSLMLGLRSGRSKERFVRTCSEIAPNVGTVREPAMPICSGFVCKPCLNNRKTFFLLGTQVILKILTELLSA